MPDEEVPAQPRAEQEADGVAEKAQIQVTAMISGSEMSALLRDRSPSITVNSPGAIKPTNAPVSRKASTPTRRYVQAPRLFDRSSISLSRSMGQMISKMRKATIAASDQPPRDATSS